MPGRRLSNFEVRVDRFVYASFLMRVLASCQGHEVLLQGRSVFMELNKKCSMVPATSWGRTW
jgi:hypothetical protein